MTPDEKRATLEWLDVKEAEGGVVMDGTHIPLSEIKGWVSAHTPEGAQP